MQILMTCKKRLEKISKFFDDAPRILPPIFNLNDDDEFDDDSSATSHRTDESGVSSITDSSCGSNSRVNGRSRSHGTGGRGAAVAKAGIQAGHMPSYQSGREGLKNGGSAFNFDFGDDSDEDDDEDDDDDDDDIGNDCDATGDELRTQLSSMSVSSEFTGMNTPGGTAPAVAAPLGPSGSSGLSPGPSNTTV